MRTFKRAISIITALAILVMTFSFLGLMPVSAEVTAPEGYEIAEQIKIDFNTDGNGWSGTNGTKGTHIDQITDPDDSSNKYMYLYTPNGNGYNMELANSSTSTTAYEMTASTKYSIEFKVKVASYTKAENQIAICFGTQAGYNANLAKPVMNTWTVDKLSTEAWTTVSYEWTTTETMLANTYASSTSKTNLCNRIYLVANNGSSAAAYYIDDVVITKYREISASTPKNQITYINFNTEGKGWSDTNGSSYLTQVTDTEDSTNKYMTLHTPNGDGYNMELASGSNSDTAYILEGSTKYLLTFKYKALDSASGNLSLYYGSISAYKSSNPKYGPLTSWAASSANDGEWHTATYEFTTTETMTYASYKGSGSTTVCDNLYLVARSNQNTWAIDDVEIKKYVEGATEDEYVDGIAPDSGEGSGDSGEEETEKEMYTIPDFTHEPYKTYAAPDSYSGTWYCSVRWSTYTEGTNSVMRYKFAYDISEEAASTSGKRGTTAKGTNGSQHAMMCLVDDDNPSVPLYVTQNKSYRVSFKYKVTDVELNSFVSFNIMRGQYSSSWTGSSGIGSSTDKDADRYIIAIEYAPTDGWVDAYYTFTANYTTNLERNVFQIGGAGYGDALIDDIKIEEIDASEVEPVNNDASKYDYSVNGQQSSINSYKGKDADLTITHVIGRRQLTSINKYAFLYNRYVKNIVIENGPTTIGNYAFEYAKVLETISIPASITTIGKGAFYGIKTMKAFTVDSASESFASVDGVLYTKDMKTLLYYPAAKDATTFTVPAGVTAIAEGAFLNATKLQTIILPDGLTTIERRAFMNCTALTSINIPETVTSVGSSALRNCSALTADGISIADGLAVGENAFTDSATYTVGSTSGDTTVDVKDATLLAKHLAGFKDSDLGRFGEMAADINGDGNVDMLDAVLLKRHLAGWKGYKSLPYTGLDDTTYEEYVTDSETPELVVNLSEKNSQKVTPKRDINYDPNKEDIIIILITGQSNSGTGGYRQEYEYKYTTNHGGAAHPNWEITAEPTRPDEGTVFFGATVTALNDANDVYYMTDAASLGASTMGGYSPAMGKALHDATGAKIVFVQASKGAVGMHEWTPEPEKYECPCGENGGGKLYSNAIANFTKTYQALEDDYNIIATAYVFNQGEHEELKTYVAESATVHDDQTYYNALLEMHNGFLSECEIDCGGVFLPRSWWNRYGLSGSDDIPQNSRRPSIARAAQYAASQNVENFFIFSNVSEEICKAGPLKPDPTNSIHYGMAAYNAIGAQNGDSVAKYFGFLDASELTGIKVFNKIGVELCAFDANGNLVSGSDVVEFSDDNSKLYIRIDPTGTMYTLNYSSAGTTTDFVDDFGIITSVEGQTSFKIVINPPVK
ncbi:MAG: leucine-rich repeat protein [Clostridia bacterium]|nr:leucine-rich repeat protein [Clostridia bacterium]